MKSRARQAMSARCMLFGWLVVVGAYAAPLAAQSGTSDAPPLVARGPAGEPLSEKLALAPPPEDLTSLNLSAGGSISSGNTDAYQALVGGDFKLIRQPHALSVNAAFAYGRAGVKEEGSSSERLVETVKNLNARAKYDLFVSELNALFIATGFRWDPFAGIKHRNSGQIGYGRYFIHEPKHRFWSELGYDLTGTAYQRLPTATDGQPSKSSEIVHSGRVFVGYENQLNEAVTYLGGVEGLINLEKPAASRLNWDNALRSSLNANFKLELKFRLAFENQPVVRDAKHVDTATTVSLLYTLI